jgi:hypothetical protein
VGCRIAPSPDRRRPSPRGAWEAIAYPGAIFDEQAGCWVSDAEIAEVSYTAFASKKNQATTGRLMVRRVKRLSPRAGIGQDELFSTYRYHAVFTDSPFHLVQAEEQHRDHAIVEKVFADLVGGPLAHLPSGDFAANAAWPTCAAITHNLLRATGCLAGPAHAKARGATVRRRLIPRARPLGPARTRSHRPPLTPALALAGRVDERLRRRPRPTAPGLVA